MKAIPVFAVALVCALALGSCVTWRWNECTKVGHGGLYCLWDLGRK